MDARPVAARVAGAVHARLTGAVGARLAGAIGVAALLTACTGPPGDDAAPDPPAPDRPTPTATAEPPTRSPTELELSEFITSAGDFVPSTHPGLLVVTRAGFGEIADDGTVDRGRLVPPLPEDHVWKCLTEGGAVVCLGLGDTQRFVASSGPRCGTVQLEQHRVGRSTVTHRTYGPGGRMTQQITHETYGEHFTVPGSDVRTEGGTDVYVIDDLGRDGATVRTRRVVGTESYQFSFPGELIVVNHGELHIEDPDGDAGVTVVSGRWDRIEDPTGARERLCAVFEREEAA